jgi:hypothetical protein
MQEALKVKMDHVFFREYVKQQQQDDGAAAKQFKLEERIFLLE